MTRPHPAAPQRLCTRPCMHLPCVQAAPGLWNRAGRLTQLKPLLLLLFSDRPHRRSSA